MTFTEGSLTPCMACLAQRLIMLTTKSVLVVGCLGILVACGGGGSSGAAPTPNTAPAATVSGQITFDLVPLTTNPVRLDYNATQASPVRGVTVQLIDVLSGVNVLGNTVTDANGDYTIVGPADTQVFLRVRAEMLQAGAPGWDIRVVDNTNINALYVVDSRPFDTGIMDTVQNFHAASGWTGSSYGEPRAAAPLAILDAIYDAVQLILTADPTVSFPPLVMNWSPNNNTSLGANGKPDLATGDIGSAFFRPSESGEIFLTGRENDSTDEYDRGLILHEWVHYFQRAFSRDDTLGGTHSRGDQLDMRSAFSEGIASGVAGMILADGVYRDTFGIRQQSGFSIKMEGENGSNRGWYSEESVQEIIYDLFDADVDSAVDTLSLGFTPLYRVLTNQVRTSMAVTSIFPFIDALKGDLPGSAALIDDLVSAQSIAVIADEYGSRRVNSGNPASGDVMPLYANLTVNGGPVNVCSTDDFSSPTTGSTNKLGSRRFLRFAVATAGEHTLSATTTVAPAGKRADPVMVLHQRKPLSLFQNKPDLSCTPLLLANCKEVAAVTLSVGDWLLEVYESTNTNAGDDHASPPIGRTCFDVEVTR